MSNQGFHSILSKLDDHYNRVIDFLLVLSTMLVLLLSVLVIVLRWFNTTLFWYDPFVRHLVFLLAFLGGAKASAKGTHISIDLLSRSLEGLERKWIVKIHQVFVALISLAILTALVIAGYRFMMVEFEYGRAVFFGIHSAYLVGIIPVGFALIFIQCFLTMLRRLSAKENI